MTPNQKEMVRWTALKSERSSWIGQYQEINRFLLPRSGRFLPQDRNRGNKRHNEILDGTGTWALRVLAAGMMAGMTSPARPWFRLSTGDPELNESSAVKEWLSDVTRLMLHIFAKGNTYRALHTGYEELGAFGTWSNIVLDDYEGVIHHYPLTVGEYAIATDWKGNVNTLYREFQKTVAETVGEFGIENVSPTVKSLYDRGALDEWVTILHAIEPRSDRDPRMRDAKNMAWKSCYFEPAGKSGKYLRESGFKQFPALAARWGAVGGDIYGTSPAMDAMGSVKALQQEQLRKAQGIDYKTNPPLQIPSSLKMSQVDRLPGGATFYDGATPSAGIRTMFDVNLDLNHLLVDIQDVRELIRTAFNADLFLMLANSTNPQMTATEVAERHEEKLLVLGPVLERLHSELLNPLIDRTFDRMIQVGMLPPPPPEMEEVELNVEFVSMLAQAQRAISTNGIDRFVGNLGVVAQMKPEVLDKFDADEWVEKYSDMLGVDPELIVPGPDVARIRSARQEAMAAQQQAAVAEQMAGAAQKLGTVETGPDANNAASSVLDAFSGYT